MFAISQRHRKTFQKGPDAIRSALFFIGVLMGVSPAAGKTNDPPSSNSSWYDRGHHSLSEQVIKSGNWFDAFFGDERIEEEVKGTRLRLRTSLKVEEGVDVKPRASFNLKLALPQLEDRLQIIIDSVRRDEEDTDDTERIENSFGSLEDDFDVSAATRVVLGKILDSQLDFDVGMKLKVDQADPFVKLRTKKIFDNDQLAIRVTQFLVWQSGDGFGETTRFDLDTTLSEDRFLRFSTAATWSEVSHGVEFENQLSLYKHLNTSKRAIGLEISTETQTNPGELNLVRTLVRYRQRIHRDWMFFEIAPEAQFPEDRDFNFTPRLTFRLDIMYGDYK